ncbi:unnamed protein product [Larinioides sclopetarius]|uniref:Uncharacterized protein n=1 Tax=Larinioides sclopetarius TaxID=280406 RepID=A0AAV2ADT6_9ARAC
MECIDAFVRDLLLLREEVAKSLLEESETRITSKRGNVWRKQNHPPNMYDDQSLIWKTQQMKLCSSLLKTLRIP